MCIGSFENCPLLTNEEQRAQHNFEERKGPYPLALALRLEAEGVMMRTEHLERSIVLINKNALQGFRWGDRTAAERAYVLGTLHVIPTDEYLTPVNQGKIHKMAREERRAYFNRTAGREETTIEFLVGYPEAGQWLGELLAVKAISTATMARKFAVHPGMLGQLAPSMGEKYLARLVFDLAIVRGFDQGIRLSCDPVHECLAHLANLVGCTKAARCDVAREVEEAVRLNARAAGKFPGDRQQQRQARRKARKECSRKLNLLRNEFYKRPDALQIIATVVRDLKAPTPTLAQAA